MKQLLVTVVICFLFVINLDVHSQDTPHTLPSPLTFTSSKSNFYGSDVFIVNPDTLDFQPLIHFESPDRLAGSFWSPNGEFIAIIVQSSQNNSICIFTSEGTEIRCIEIVIWEFSTLHFPIYWSNDSTHISVIIRSESDVPEIAFIDVSTENTSHVSLNLSEPELLYRIYWSTDGNYLLYQTQTDQQTYDPLNLSIFDISTGSHQLISNQTHDTCVDWTNQTENAQTLASVSEDGIQIIDTQGNIISTINPTYLSPLDVSCPIAWSSDNSQLAFFALFNEGYNAGIFTVPIEGGNAALISTETSFNYIPQVISWSPDDTHIAIEALYSAFSDIRVMSLDGWGRTYLREGIPLSDPSWQPLP